MSTITLNVPYPKRHLTTEIKLRGGKFDATTKSWALEDNQENRQLAEIIQRPSTGPTPEERVRNVAATAVELLNALGQRKYRLAESGSRIVIESDTLAA